MLEFITGFITCFAVFVTLGLIRVFRKARLRKQDVKEQIVIVKGDR